MHRGRLRHQTRGGRPAPMMDSEPTNWGDFLVFGAFLFFLGIGWTFSRCYRDFFRECESARSRNEIMEAVFGRSSVEALAILGFAGLVLLVGTLRRGAAEPPASEDSGNRWSVWFAWVPFLAYAACRLAEDRWSAGRGGAWRRVSRLCLAATFLCQFVALSAHMRRLPDGTDRAMYQPQCLTALVAAGVTVAEAVAPAGRGRRARRWLRCGCTMVQGTWYVQVGFTLCVSGREWRRDDGVTLTVALIFAWHVALSTVIVHFVRKTVKSALCAEPCADGDLESGDEDYDIVDVFDDDREDQDEAFDDIHKYKT